ncbi:MAG: hypothetical protein K5798_08720 [Nitrosopumilus sp.]|uniref:hypothetical protein n=1 Tax=Nitrosopumilus sp. TaxID=2024843 RepID=UPI0024329882|nr:hypothetical protein [Nitrosopumilus sp.]MCV0367325.1 hypothetical protein [Nitrosopumilus sp.]
MSSPISREDFNQKFMSVEKSLKKLLNENIFEKEKKHPIRQGFVNSATYFTNGQYDISIYELMKMMLLERDLKQIKEYDETEFQKFKKWLTKTVKTPDDYFGVRFEIEVFTLLVQGKCTEFIKREKPDFEITEFNSTVYVECTTKHLGVVRDGDYLDKITDAIEDKASKDYSNHKTALFLDITNLLHHRQQNKNSENMDDELEEHVRTLESSKSFGSILLFFMAHPKKYRLLPVFYRIDSEKINSELLKFLDKYFPHDPQDMNLIFPPRT